MDDQVFLQNRDLLAAGRVERAQIIADAGGVREAVRSGALPKIVSITVSEALILGLLQQDVTTFIAVFGHGSTEIGEVLRIYRHAGLLRVFNVRSETEASHAAAALRWVTGEKAAVVTSIGPGALQALSAALVPASNGIGVWYLVGDETTEDEGPNMQQIPRSEQSQFLRLFSAMGKSYSLHTPLALPTALRRGINTVDHPHRPGPFFLLMPLNTQSMEISRFNLDELPWGSPPRLGPADDSAAYEQAAEAIQKAERILVRVGGGARQSGPEVDRLLDLIDGVAIVSPIALGVLPDGHPRNMTVGGSKGSLSGNYAMEHADLLIVIGSRSVCQSDGSRTGYPCVRDVININTDVEAAMHYGNTIAFVGDAAPTIRKLIDTLERRGAAPRAEPSEWLKETQHQRQSWQAFRNERYTHPLLFDPVWGQEVLTQPAALKTISDWAKAKRAVCFFDAGDVQANGFQVFEADLFGQSISDVGASYMGFAASALLATGISQKPFYGLALSGDGSFTMNPQILIDGVQHGARGCIVIFDNRRMAAISGLQSAQYGQEFATNDQVNVDYVAWGKAVRGVNAMHGGYSPESLLAALEQAAAYPGLSLIHLPVYYGPDELGGMGVFGRWNVGNWSEDTQNLRHQIGL